MARNSTFPDDLSDLAYILEADRHLTEPQPAKIRDSEQYLGLRRSIAKSLVPFRESLFGPPPPPPKDALPQPQMISKLPFRNNQVRKTIDSQSSTVDSIETSAEIRIAMMLSISDETAKVETISRSSTPSTPSTLNPLQMSPPSHIVPVTKTPRRPSRTASLRLSSLTRKEALTSDKVVVLDPSRPSYSHSIRSHTRDSITSQGNRIKYGRGKYATTELVPRPSDNAEDPLNWQPWRKELNFYALLMTVAMVNVMKTALISVNGVLVDQLSVSYTAVAALTGVPLMVSAVTGLAGSSAAKLWGRRPVYLVSIIFIFIGLVWNSRVSSSYAQFMVARIFQGLGWGAFDTLVLGTILNTYFEHEHCTKIGIYRVVSVVTLWGSPLIGGLTSQNTMGLALQFEILAIFQVISIPLIVLGAPETMYDRSSPDTLTAGWTPRMGWASLGLKSSTRYTSLPTWARGRHLTIDRMVQYVKSVSRPQSYSGTPDGRVSSTLLLQAPRALVSPTTLLAFSTSFLPNCLLWGFSFALSGLFAPAPYSLSPTTVGSLLTAPFILSTLVVALFSFWPAWSKTYTAFGVRSTPLFQLSAGSILSYIGTLGFGLYVAYHVSQEQTQVTDSPDTATKLSFPALSFILGLLAAGSSILDASTGPLIHRSAQFTSPNLSTNMRNVEDMDAGVVFWRNLFSSIFIMGIPAATVASRATAAAGLRDTGIVIAIMQIFVAVLIAGVWFLFQEEDLWRLDGRILQCVDLTPIKGSKSYFEITD